MGILGIMQVQGRNNSLAIMPVIKYQSLRTILAFACEEGIHVYHMGVKSTFLNGDLEEEVFME